MSVHYKFKSAKDFSTINFDGSYISVGDLKQAIVEQKKLAKSIENFDLQITNAQTSEGAPSNTPGYYIIFYF
jgi:E3 ubiquitin-protein ligase RBBP6